MLDWFHVLQILRNYNEVINPGSHLHKREWVFSYHIDYCSLATIPTQLKVTESATGSSSDVAGRGSRATSTQGHLAPFCRDLPRNLFVLLVSRGRGGRGGEWRRSGDGERTARGGRANHCDGIERKRDPALFTWSPADWIVLSLLKPSRALMQATSVCTQRPVRSSPLNHKEGILQIDIYALKISVFRNLFLNNGRGSKLFLKNEMTRTG